MQSVKLVTSTMLMLIRISSYIESNSCQFQTRMDVSNIHGRADSFAALANETVPRRRRGTSKTKNSHAERADRRRWIRFDNKLHRPRCT